MTAALEGGWVVSSTPRPHFTLGKDPVPILQEDGWAPGPVWTDGKSRPHRDSIPDRPARSQSLCRLSYPAHLLAILKKLKQTDNERRKRVCLLQNAQHSSEPHPVTFQWAWEVKRSKRVADHTLFQLVTRLRISGHISLLPTRPHGEYCGNFTYTLYDGQLALLWPHEWVRMDGVDKEERAV